MPGGWEGSSRYAVAADGANQVLEVQSPAGHVADYLFSGDTTWGDIVLSARVSVRDASGEYYGVPSEVRSPERSLDRDEASSSSTRRANC